MTLKIYQTTSTFPREEMYGLTSQIRRSGASVPTNIAEGCGRNSDAELARFLEISMGSASELEYLLLLTRGLNLINTSDYTELTDEVIEVKRMLAVFIKKLRAESLQIPYPVRNPGNPDHLFHIMNSYDVGTVEDADSDGGSGAFESFGGWNVTEELADKGLS